MRNEVALMNALIEGHEDRLQRAEERILDAIAMLTRHHANGDRSAIAASLAAMIRPSRQILVWD